MLIVIIFFFDLVGWTHFKFDTENIENVNVVSLITMLSISDIMIKRKILITLMIVSF